MAGIFNRKSEKTNLQMVSLSKVWVKKKQELTKHEDLTNIGPPSRMFPSLTSGIWTREEGIVLWQALIDQKATPSMGKTDVGPMFFSATLYHHVSHFKKNKCSLWLHGELDNSERLLYVPWRNTQLRPWWMDSENKLFPLFCFET